MNVISSEEISRLRDAFDRGLGVRAAAREVGVNRETCGKYFAQWRAAPIQDPHERVKNLRLIAEMEAWFLKIEPERVPELREAFYSGLAKSRAAKMFKAN